MVMPDTSAEEAILLFEEFRMKLEQATFDYNGHPLSVRVSIGLAQSGLHSNDGRVLFNLADDALYECKRNGRNQVRISKKDQELSNAG